MVDQIIMTDAILHSNDIYSPTDKKELVYKFQNDFIRFIHFHT